MSSSHISVEFTYQPKYLDAGNHLRKVLWDKEESGLPPASGASVLVEKTAEEGGRTGASFSFQLMPEEIPKEGEKRTGLMHRNFGLSRKERLETSFRMGSIKPIETNLQSPSERASYRDHQLCLKDLATFRSSPRLTRCPQLPHY